MKYHILIADDEERIVQSLSQIIGDAFADEVEVRTASNGLECVKIIEEWPVKLLITDIRMPGISGIELVEKLRQKEEYMDILVISAYEDFNYAKRLIPFGVMEYLVKPISVNQILSQVKKAIKKDSQEVKKVWENNNDQDSNYRTKKMIKEAKDYINKEVYNPLSLSDLAEFLHVNKSYLSATFKQEAGENVSAYINAVKIKEAKKLLLETEWSVSEIAEKLGYSSSKYFIEKFTKSTGMTPSKFRGLLHQSIK